jgi:hypothetical protein
MQRNVRSRASQHLAPGKVPAISRGGLHSDTRYGTRSHLVDSLRIAVRYGHLHQGCTVQYRPYPATVLVRHTVQDEPLPAVEADAHPPALPGQLRAL